MTAPPEQTPNQRIELVDDRGVVRVVLGRLEGGANTIGPEAYGLSLRGVDGAERVALSVDDHGPTLVFVRGGNIAIQVGVDDPLVPGDHAGAFITLAGADGAPLLYVSAEDDGSLQIRSAFGPPPAST